MAEGAGQVEAVGGQGAAEETKQQAAEETEQGRGVANQGEMKVDRG